jgi:hypothetical protein
MKNPFKVGQKITVESGMSQKLIGLKGVVMYIDGEWCEVDLGRKDYDRVHYLALKNESGIICIKCSKPIPRINGYYTVDGDGSCLPCIKSNNSYMWNIPHKVNKPDQINKPDQVKPDKTEAQYRKDTPIYSGFINYFPLAIAEVARLSKAGNDQHNPNKPLHWDRSKSGDELDALTRHLVDAGTIDKDGQRHSAKIAWRALANLEKELEKE